MNPKTKTPAAPPVYRPQPVPRVLQTKTNRGTSHRVTNTASPSRILQASGLNLHRAPVAVGRASVIQRMEGRPEAPQPAAAAGAGRSGRSAEDLWTTFCTYPFKDQREKIERAFLDAGYNINNIRKAIKRAIKALKLDLSAHARGQYGDGMQGPLTAEVEDWVEKLTAWAEANPPGARVVVPGQRHSPEVQERVRQQNLEREAKKAPAKKEKAIAACKASGKHWAGGKSGVCKNCGGS